MTTNLILVGRVVALICTASIFGFLKHRRQADVVQLFGLALLLVMVLTHVAEYLQLLKAMRWGHPDSIGHYLDLTSAVGGLGLLCCAIAMKLARKGHPAG
jgi:hypothetical protein